ncbi:MAG: GntR family transcriptional regulator [Pseudomonadota bacterium]
MAIESATTAGRERRTYAGPLYVQLIGRLRDRIRSGDWTAGMVLPSESDLAREYGVSVGTARKALEGLEDGGWIIRKQGRGTFVADLADLHKDRLCRFRSLETGEDSFLGSVSTVIGQEQGEASDAEAHDLDLDPGADVVRTARVCKRDSRFRVFERLITPVEYFPDMQQKTEPLPTNLFAMLIEKFGAIPQRSRDRVCARAATDDVAKHLGVSVGSPVLLVESLIWDIDDRRIALIERWAMLEDAAYEVELS